MTHPELKEVILKVDEELSESLVNNLMKQLPPQEIIDSVKEFKKQYQELALAEQFLCTVICYYVLISYSLQARKIQ